MSSLNNFRIPLKTVKEYKHILQDKEHSIHTPIFIPNPLESRLTMGVSVAMYVPPVLPVSFKRQPCHVNTATLAPGKNV